MGDLSGRVALVTGVSRRKGIGFAIAQRLSALGADLYVHSFAAYDATQPWGVDLSDPSSLLEELSRDGGKVAHRDVDLELPGAPESLLASAVEVCGHVDILVVNHACSEVGRLEQLTGESLDRHLHVNVRASLLLVKAFAAQHDGRTGGRVVLLVSGQHLAPMPDELAYAASKGALQQITLSLSAPRSTQNHGERRQSRRHGYWLCVS